jgi:hypothetical protein
MGLSPGDLVRVSGRGRTTHWVDGEGQPLTGTVVLLGAGGMVYVRWSWLGGLWMRRDEVTALPPEPRNPPLDNAREP